jgi:hypothetical protein
VGVSEFSTIDGTQEKRTSSYCVQRPIQGEIPMTESVKYKVCGSESASESLVTLLITLVLYMYTHPAAVYRNSPNSESTCGRKLLNTYTGNFYYLCGRVQLTGRLRCVESRDFLRLGRHHVFGKFR